MQKKLNKYELKSILTNVLLAISGKLTGSLKDKRIW